MERQDQGIYHHEFEPLHLQWSSVHSWFFYRKIHAGNFWETSIHTPLQKRSVMSQCYKTIIGMRERKERDGDRDTDRQTDRRTDREMERESYAHYMSSNMAKLLSQVSSWNVISLVENADRIYVCSKLVWRNFNAFVIPSSITYLSAKLNSWNH